uniref:Putative secreted protein n=1 Tax=Amblyomma triste TaxID=251400 RepID=A0A023G382_AMBTT
MFVQVGAVVLLAACAWASPGHIDFIIDQVLAGAGVDVLDLPDISFDVDNQHNWTFSGYVEFHLQNGTLGNLRRRVRRVGDCGLRGDQDAGSPLVEIWCNLNLRGVVARYDVEVIVDDRSKSVVAELLVDTGNVYFKFESRQDNCTECSHFTDFQVTDVTARLKPLGVALDYAPDVIQQFENEVVSRAPKHISYAFTAAYKRALAKMIATLRASEFTD